MPAKPSIESNPPLDLVAVVSRIPFQDPAGARANLARVLERISPGLAAALPALFSESPDPDSALILFDRLISESPAEIARLFEHHPSLAHYAIVIFGHSRFLGETLLQNPDLLQSFLKEENLDRSFSAEDFQQNLARVRSRSFETDVSLLLARFKRREYVRIVLRDVLRIAPLAETTAEISALSDVLIQEALREAEAHLLRRYDAPQHLDAEGRLVDTPFAILSLGKLGGQELNYSSDVDLMYLFGDGIEPADAHISAREYFIRLAQQVTDILSRLTREGPVFRIDLRLRPQGGEGELAIKLEQALRYYATAAHDWEQQALIKVRHSAGDPSLGREFIRGVQPHIYKEKINFAAIKTALVAREKMDKGRKHELAKAASDGSIDVKLDRGGIRDIEFLVQCLQRVYGGAEPWLRSGGTLFSLQTLHDKRHISSKEFHELTSAYEFLRHLEHRLQLRQGQQTHRLAASGPELEMLRRSMDAFARTDAHAQDFSALVRRRMAAVGEIYQHVIYQQQNRSEAEAPDAEFRLHSALPPSPADPSNRQILERLALDAPALYATATRDDLSPVAHKNLFRFLSAAFTTSERYAALRRHPGTIDRALTLLETSEYLTQILVHYPEELATLAELDESPSRAGSGYLFESFAEHGHARGDPVFAYLAESSAPYGEKLALLRQHFRHRIFAACAKDIIERRSVYESLTSTSVALQDAIGAAFGIASAPQGLAVMALGSLGSGEFDVLSDADVLLICAEDQNREHLTKSAERMMQALAAYTQQGMVSPVDARLRPRGGEGELLVTPAQLASYFEHEAQAWEALMYTKLRFLAGSRELAAAAVGACKSLFERFSADTSFPWAAREMRTKLESSEKNFKTSPGAIYDVDFLSSFLLVQHGIADKTGNLRDRIWRCASAGLLQKPDAAVLDHAAELLKTVEHIVRLVVGRARKWLPAADHARQVTEKLAAQILNREFPCGLEAELEQTLESVRKIFERYLPSSGPGLGQVDAV